MEGVEEIIDDEDNKLDKESEKQAPLKNPKEKN